eukprot:sb/3472498/
MFIVVRYGNNQELLFNPLCRIANLLSDIKQRCELTQPIENLDLCDENGVAKELPVHFQAYGSRFLDAPGTYVVVERRKVAVEIPPDQQTPEGEETRTEIIFTSLLHDASKHIPGFIPHVAVIKAQNPKEGKKGRKGKEMSVPSPTSLKSVSMMKANKAARSKGRK